MESTRGREGEFGVPGSRLQAARQSSDQPLSASRGRGPKFRVGPPTRRLARALNRSFSPKPPRSAHGEFARFAAAHLIVWEPGGFVSRLLTQLYHW